MRVLVLADNCNPEWPSLPVVGYKSARALAEYADVVVATQIRNRTNIEKVGFGKAHVRYFDSEYIARPMYQFSRFLRGGSEGAWTTAVALAYPANLAFEWEVWKAFRNELRAGAFDVVHRLTPMSPTLPSPMATWSPVPFVLGPLNGGLKWPPQFREELARERETLRKLRHLYKWLPYHDSTFSDSAAILASFAHTLADMPPSARDRCIDFPEVGVAPELFQHPGERPEKQQLVFINVGRFVPLKLLDVAIRVFAASPKLRQHKLVL